MNARVRNHEPLEFIHFVISLLSLGMILPGSARNPPGVISGIPDRMHGGVVEGAPHKYFVAPASFHLSVWNRAGDA